MVYFSFKKPGVEYPVPQCVVSFRLKKLLPTLFCVWSNLSRQSQGRQLLKLFRNINIIINTSYTKHYLALYHQKLRFLWNIKSKFVRPARCPWTEDQGLNTFLYIRAASSNRNQFLLVHLLVKPQGIQNEQASRIW